MNNDLDHQTADGGTFLPAGTSCSNCVHRDVCGIVRGVEPMFEQQFPELDPDDMAKMCPHFEPGSNADE